MTTTAMDLVRVDPLGEKLASKKTGDHATAATM
jgi:hypothetical protein